MSGNFVLRSYISGVQQYLNAAGHVKYAMEGAAEVDNEALAAGLEQRVPEMLEAHGAPQTEINNEALATEGMPPEINATVAKAVAEMAAQVGEDSQVAKAKAEIIENAAAEMAGNQKIASVIVVSGQGKGTKAAETVTGEDEKLNATQIDNDATRTSARTAPGTEADEGKGMQGEEKVTPLPKPASAATAPEKLNATQIDNDTNRDHPSTAPGTEADKGKGMQGEEVVREKISSILDHLNLK